MKCSNLTFTSICISLAYLALNLESWANSSIAVMTQPAKRYFDTATTTESGWLLPGESKEDQESFVEWVKTNWELILDNWQITAPTSRQKDLILVAAEQLSPPEYLEFVRKATSMPWFKNEPRHVIETMTWGSAQKRGFLSWNYSSPGVQGIYASISSNLLPNDPLQTHLKKAIGGELKGTHSATSTIKPETLEIKEKKGVSVTASSSSTQLTPSGEPTSSTPWSIIVVLIVAVIGLLWLLLKKRK